MKAKHLEILEALLKDELAWEDVETEKVAALEAAIDAIEEAIAAYTPPQVQTVKRDGEAVVWAHPSTLELLDRCRNDEHNGTVEVWMREHTDLGVTSPLYASPPATVPVKELRKLEKSWRNLWADGYATGVHSIDDATNNRISQADMCADELAALIEGAK